MIVNELSYFVDSIRRSGFITFGFMFLGINAFLSLYKFISKSFSVDSCSDVMCESIPQIENSLVESFSDEELIRELEPAHIEMVICPHCLAPKLLNHTCIYCGLG